MDCLFCRLVREEPQRIVAQSPECYVIRDGFPVTDGHTLIITKRHATEWFDLEANEVHSVHTLLREQANRLRIEDPSIEGFNIGMNCGQVAGQTIFHCHTHLIPRRRGDVENPRGGVRHVIPGKGLY
jgi:ATP adenylyltransferase